MSHEASAAARRRVLIALRTLGDAFDRMHGTLEDDMDMNVTDVRALRMLIDAEQRGGDVSPHDLAAHLRISTASTTKMLDRLSAGGYVDRVPHPTDRRALLVRLTPHSRESFLTHFGAHLDVMRGVSGEFDDDELDAISRFLERLSARIAPRG